MVSFSLNEPLSSKSMLSLTQLIFLGQIILQFAFRVESTKDSIIFCISRTWLCYFASFLFAYWKMSEDFYKTPWILGARSVQIFMLISILLASLSLTCTCKIVIKSLCRRKGCSVRKSLEQDDLSKLNECNWFPKIYFTKLGSLFIKEKVSRTFESNTGVLMSSENNFACCIDLARLESGVTVF